MTKRRILTLVGFALTVVGGYWFYSTTYQKYIIRSHVYAAREMLRAGELDEKQCVQYADDIYDIFAQAITPSVREELEAYAGSFAKSGDPELFFAGVMVDQPYWKLANGIGPEHTVPSCLTILSSLDKYPSSSRAVLENLISGILPGASKQSVGMEDGQFTQDPAKRQQAVLQWAELIKQKLEHELTEDAPLTSSPEDAIREVRSATLLMRNARLHMKASAQDLDAGSNPNQRAR